MSVRRKLFVAIASFIVIMGLLYVFLTLTVVRGILHFMLDVDRAAETEQLSSLFAEYYAGNGGSWSGVDRLPTDGLLWSRNPQAGFILLSPQDERLYSAGDYHPEYTKRLGLSQRVAWNGATIAVLYYTDREVSNIAKLRLGVSSSVTVLLLAGSILFVLVSLLVAYLLAKRLTAPLRLLLPALDRLGQGELGVQVPVTSQDEYGKMAQAFNTMSAQIQQTESARRNLVADVAHELRTPITIIRGKLELVQQGGQAVEPASLLPLQDELIRLTRLVDDLNQLSLAEAKRLVIERKPTDLPLLMERIIERIAPDAESKSIAVTLNSAADNLVLNLDPNRMTQVFLNLLLNALRYTPEGGAVTIDIMPAEHRKGVQVTVSDTGIGIAPEHLPRLFDRFYRTDEARSRNSGGLGLGLAIAREFVEAHQGTLTARSELGRGTAFIVTLPA